MKRVCISSLLVLFIISGFSQNKIAKGYVLDEYTLAPIDSAIVAFKNKAIYTYTDVTGYFSIQLPKRRGHLDFLHKEYTDKRVLLKLGFQQRNTIIHLESIHSKIYRDSIFNGHKNTFTISILELFAVAIAARYERFLGFKHSTGIHASYYIYGHDSFDVFAYENCGSGSYQVSTKYHGYKIAPFYRYYMRRNGTYGVFLEGKIPFGYFDFGEIEYHVSSNTYYSESIAHDFWTWGGGISIGAMFAIPKTKHGVINFSIGYQYFPMVDTPEYIYSEVNSPPGTTTTLRLHNHTKFWYMPGPGSYVEVKVLIGGIF